MYNAKNKLKVCTGQLMSWPVSRLSAGAKSMSKVVRDKSASETSLKESETRNENPSVGFILEAFQKTSIEGNNLVDLKKTNREKL